MFTELKDSQVLLQVPKYRVDDVIDDRIPDPLPKQSFFMAVIGPPGSGKSSLATSLITAKPPKRAYRRAFHHIWIVCPQSSLDSMKNNPFARHPRNKCFDQLTQENLEHIEHELEKTAADDEYSLLFLDDVAIALKDKHIQRSLNRLVCNRRHLRLSIIMVSQSYRFMPLSTRRLLTHAIVFRPSNRKESELVHEELVSHLDDWDSLMKFVYREPHDHLMLDVQRGLMYRNFNSILMT